MRQHVVNSNNMHLTKSGFKQVLYMHLTVDMCLITIIYVLNNQSLRYIHSVNYLLLQLECGYVAIYRRFSVMLITRLIINFHIKADKAVDWILKPLCYKCS